MPYHRWVINRAISRKRKAERAQLYRCADRVISNKKTERKSLLDFPAVADYLAGRFPDVDLSAVSLYISPPKVIEQAGWKDIGGCYVRDLDVIFVKSKISTHKKSKSKFQRMVHEICDAHVDVEDVVVHEFIHAVSSKIGRALSRYTHMEEEFVYTNCIDFYKAKGLSEEEIADSNFLPFCLNDVYKSPKDMAKILSQLGCSIEEVRELSDFEYQRWANTHAGDLVPLLKKKAQEKAHQMIELYKKYGEMNRTSVDEKPEDPTTARFSALEID